MVHYWCNLNIPECTFIVKMALPNPIRRHRYSILNSLHAAFLQLLSSALPDRLCLQRERQLRDPDEAGSWLLFAGCRSYSPRLLSFLFMVQIGLWQSTIGNQEAQMKGEPHQVFRG
jgi:hypothetical protein